MRSHGFALLCNVCLLFFVSFLSMTFFYSHFLAFHLMPYAIHDKLFPKENPEKLLILGETTWRKRYQRFGMLPSDRLRHLWVLGKTGSGKSTLLASLLAQDVAAGRGVAILDPHGALVQAVLPHIPRSRTNEVLLFSPTDAVHQVAFNVFRQGRRPHPNPALLTAELVSVFKKQWADSWGPRLEHVLRNAILAIAHHPNATLLFLYRFLTDEKLRAAISEKIVDPVVRTFWTIEFPSYPKSLQGEALSPVLNKLGAFVSNPIIRGIVGSERSRIDLVSLMNHSQILLADLSTGQIGEDASRLLGGLLLTSLQLAAMHRGQSSPPPFFIYVDEFQNFVTDSLATMLAESRKFGLGLILAHQYLSQLPLALRDAVLGNVGSMVLFALGAEDAYVLEKEFFPPYSAGDLQRLGLYETAVKLLVRGQTPDPFSARTLQPLATPYDADAISERIRAQSRQRYGRRTAATEPGVSMAIGNG